MSNFRTYLIHPGKHYSNVNPLRRIIPHLRNRIEFIIRLDESINYQAESDKEQQSWHKLIGLKESTLKDNSARLGVRKYGDEVQFCLYVHCNDENLGALDPPIVYSTRNIKEEIHGWIEADGDLYRLDVNGHKAMEQRGGKGLFWWKMWPYFQVKFKTAFDEHIIRIKMKIL